jgi:hypothetical protein
MRKIILAAAILAGAAAISAPGVAYACSESAHCYVTSAWNMNAGAGESLNGVAAELYVNQDYEAYVTVENILWVYGLNGCYVKDGIEDTWFFVEDNCGLPQGGTYAIEGLQSSAHPYWAYLVWAGGNTWCAQYPAQGYQLCVNNVPGPAHEVGTGIEMDGPIVNSDFNGGTIPWEETGNYQWYRQWNGGTTHPFVNNSAGPWCYDFPWPGEPSGSMAYSFGDTCG